MKKMLVLFSSLTLTCILIACLGAREQQAVVTEIPEFQNFVDARNYLIHTYNAEQKQASGLFLPNAIMVDETGQVFSNKSTIEEHLTELQEEIPKVDDYNVWNTTEFVRGKAYEIGYFLNKGKTTHQYLLIWDYSSGSYLIELAIISSITTNPPAIEEIDAVRESWMTYCNAHDAAALINNLYAPHAVYYNHKPPLQGRQAIIAEYQYMNNPSYSLSLKPIVVTGGREDLLFEIGQCSGSYGGKYIIAWQLQPDGSWQILMDSNF